MIVIPPIYAIANFAESSESTLLYVRRLLDAGARLIQLRAKNLPPEQHLALARQACAFCREEQYNHSSRTLFIINDDPGLCLACGADGVHLGQEDTAPEDARQMLGKDAVIGLSTHNLEQLSRAPFPALTYAAWGPVFASPTKSGHAPVTGTGLLRQAAAACPIPLVAIGGIALDNVKEVFLAGAASAAIINDLQTASDLKTHIAGFCRIWNEYKI